ncbi:MAG TPA: 50S ribosomal protein L11 methyltransferase [Azospirillaceae bacterium]|nr:50S ribosomal protein L11 methyltransferase [Azospirillaceae bacterium]
MSVQWHSGVWRIATVVPVAAAAAFTELVSQHAEAVACVEADPDGVQWLVEGTTRRQPDRAAIDADVMLVCMALGIEDPGIDVESLPPTDWLAWSLAGFPPILAGRFFIYGSHYEGRVPPGRVGLRIDAAMAFGTGEHGSTRGCLLALDRLAKGRRPARVLDMGCGSGILAIAASKMWRMPALGVDIDPISVSQARRNGRRNQAGAKLRFACGDGYTTPAVGRAGQYDLVFANILARPLVRMAPKLKRHLKPGGTAILSGLLARQERMVLAGHRAQGLVLAERHTVGDWRTLVLRRRGRAVPKS